RRVEEHRVDHVDRGADAIEIQPGHRADRTDRPPPPVLVLISSRIRDEISTRSRGGQRFLTISAISSPASVGLRPTCTPAARSASILPAAVPLPPDTMAPA